MSDISGKLIVPFKWKSMITEIVPEMYCPNHVFYLVDKSGNVHTFQYTGQNLHRRSIGEVATEIKTKDELNEFLKRLP